MSRFLTHLQWQQGQYWLITRFYKQKYYKACAHGWTFQIHHFMHFFHSYCCLRVSALSILLVNCCASSRKTIVIGALLNCVDLYQPASPRMYANFLWYAATIPESCQWLNYQRLLAFELSSTGIYIRGFCFYRRHYTLFRMWVSTWLYGCSVAFLMILNSSISAAYHIFTGFVTHSTNTIIPATTFSSGREQWKCSVFTAHRPEPPDRKYEQVYRLRWSTVPWTIGIYSTLRTTPDIASIKHT